MNEFFGDPAEAEADLRRASDALIAAEDRVDDAEARLEELEEEASTSSPEEDGKWSRLMQEADEKVLAARVERQEAEDELHRTHDYWVAQGYLPES